MHQFMGRISVKLLGVLLLCTKKVLAAYSEAVLLKDWPLAWNSAPILATSSVVPPEFSWGAFRLRSPPAFPTVLAHLEV